MKAIPLIKKITWVFKIGFQEILQEHIEDILQTNSGLSCRARVGLLISMNLR